MKLLTNKLTEVKLRNTIREILTNILNEDKLDKISQKYFDLQDMVNGLQTNQKSLYTSYTQAQAKNDVTRMGKIMDSMKANQSKLNNARKLLKTAEEKYFAAVTSTYKNLELDYNE